MLRIVLYVAGGLLVLGGLPILARSLPDFAHLTPYGRGQVVGGVALVALGCGLLYAGYRRQSD